MYFEQTEAGFRRVRPAYKDCPYPLEVYNWCVNSNNKNIPTSGVSKALLELDALAGIWNNLDQLQFCIGIGHLHLTRRLLGLDFKDRKQQLRAAVARAYEATWRYSDVYCTWRDVFENASELLSDAELSLLKWEEHFLHLASIRESAGGYGQNYSKPTPTQLVENGMGDLYSFMMDSHSWLEGQAEKDATFPKNPPKIFLYLRLSEIYACFSGENPPTHLTNKYLKDGSLPEQSFIDFLVPALTAIGYPTPTTSADKVMRDITKYVADNDRWLRMTRNNRGECEINYLHFPSISLLNGLHCLSETEL